MQDLKLEKLKALPNLIKARICECYIPINLVSKAKILSIVPERILTCLRFLQLQLISFDSTLSLFQCLTQLELSFTNDIDFYLRKWFWLIGILKYFPKLRKLIIQDCEDQNLEERYNECWKVKEPPIIGPECLLSQLKTCCLRSFGGTKCGFEFAKYIIENSKVLDYMIINSKFSRDKNAKSQMLMKLSSCAKGSETCKLLFD
ncbi:hypothetical protein P8452_19367 [Trifolium repens]|nr:hypothetical protein P8452_19367 [Trifolium repens]